MSYNFKYGIYNFILSSSDNKDIIEEFNKRERKFKQRINYFEELYDIDI